MGLVINPDEGRHIDCLWTVSSGKQLGSLGIVVVEQVLADFALFIHG